MMYSKTLRGNIILVFAISVILSLLPQPRHFVSGYATSAESTLFGFETDTTEGWENSTQEGEQSISSLSPTLAEAYDGLYSLAMMTHLDDTNSDLQQGAAFVMFPGNLEGHTISAWVKCPSGSLVT